jgi:hypothetical protein
MKTLEPTGAIEHGQACLIRPQAESQPPYKYRSTKYM